MKNRRGNILVEFILILPWIVLLFLAVLWLSLWAIQAHFRDYVAYGNLREASIFSQDYYEQEK